MKKIARRILVSLTAASIALLLLSSLAWWSLHTQWFAILVRSRMVSSLQKITGGRVAIGSFSFNPDTLHATVGKLVIHGTEPAGAAPLLSVASIDIGLKILSMWRQDVDLASILITQPEIHLTVNADGTTNLPHPKTRRSNEGAVEQLLDLKVKRLEVTGGLFTLDNRQVPFAFVSQATGVVLDYNYDGPSYGVWLDTQPVMVSILKTPLKPMRIAAKGRLFHDHVSFESVKLVTGKDSSSIELTGNIQHFAQPMADASVQASLSIDEMAQFAGINSLLRNGTLALKGVAHYSAESGKFTFAGDANARRVAFTSPAFTLRDMDAAAGFVANNDGIWLKQGRASARGAHFVGEGSIKAYRVLNVAGQVSQIALQEVGTFLTKQPFPWTGSAHGTAHASANLGDAQPDFIIGAKVDIDPGTAGIPTAGSVDVTYHNRTGRVEFGDSTLSLPHSQVNLSGDLDTDLLLKADSANLADFQPLVPILGIRLEAADLPELNAGGSAHFDGTLHDLIDQQDITGDAALNKFKFRGYDFDAVEGHFSWSANELSVRKFQVQGSGATLNGSGAVELAGWAAGDNSPLRLDMRFAGMDVVKTTALFTKAALPVLQGVASGTVNFQGSLNNPHGAGNFQITNLDAYGEQLNQVQLNARLDGARVVVSQGRVQSGKALLSFSGDYRHGADWSTGDIDGKTDTNGFPLSSVSIVRRYLPWLNTRAQAHLDVSGRFQNNGFVPLKINGGAEFQHISIHERDVGNVSLAAATVGGAISFKYSGDLRGTRFRGLAEARLTEGTPIHGSLEMDRINLAAAKSLVSDAKLVLPLDGFLDGGMAFDGLLQDPARMHARATIKDLQISSIPQPGTISAPSAPDIVLKNKDPILIDVADGVLKISKFEIDGRDTSVSLSGSAPFIGGKPVDIKAVGKADMALFSLFDPNVLSSGKSELAANISGPITAMDVTGALQIRNGSFFMADIPNGLSDVNGTVVFSRNRATIQTMTGHSGGGDISVGGSLSFGAGTPLVYHLEAAARNVRVRYANSISVTGNSDLRLSGTSVNSILAGTLTVTRVVFTPNADAGNLLAAASSSGTTDTDPNEFVGGLHLDVGVESAPNLQVSTNLSRDVESEIQLRLRGTLDHPIVLGNITANQGDIKIFGTRFSLNRGEVSFVNSVRIEPVLDLDLETQARGVTVDITVSGTPSKLNFNYRSDPPLQPRDIIALLTVGRAPDVGTTANAQAGSDVSALTSGVNSVLGQAISPVSNRLSKLFGITNIKIDPFVQGITNTPQARLSVEQQISRDVTITYITNLSQTSEQIFRFEWALNRQFSIVALRDDNGEFGLDFQYKKRFK